MELAEIMKASGAADLACRLSNPAEEGDEHLSDEIVLVELNHFFSHHCALPAILRALRQRKGYRFVPYIPLLAWDETNSAIKFVQTFYECMGISRDAIKANPSYEHYQNAKELVLSQFNFFQGSIWNLTDFKFDGIPFGVHLAETLLQQFQAAEFEQNIDTVAYAVGLISRYFWWKDYLAENPVKYIIASHLCYEFAIPQLAGLSNGIDSYVWNDSYLYRSNDFLPLPMTSENWTKDIKCAWETLSEIQKASYLDLAQTELSARVEGIRVGALRIDPRFVRSSQNSEPDLTIKKTRVPNVILYCHAFSDAPCTLPKAEFRNLCSPAVSTRKIFEFCKNLPVNLFVKTHPSNFSQD